MMRGRVLNPIEYPKKTESPLFTRGEGRNMFGSGMNRPKPKFRNSNNLVI